MSFNAPPPNPQPTSSVAATIKNETWFPNIDVEKVRDATRINGNVTETRLRDALIAAMLYVNQSLKDWREQNQSYANLEAVPAAKIDEKSVNLALYLRAIYSTTKADLLERYRDYDSTDEGLRKSEQLADAIDEQRRNAAWAIADIVGRNRTTIDLI